MSSKALAVSIVIGAALGKKYISTFDSAEKRAIKLGDALKETNKKLDASKSVIAYQKKLKTLQNFQGNLGQSSDKMKRRIAAVGLELETAKRKAKAYGLSVGDIVREQRRLENQSNRLSNSINRLNRKQQAGTRLAQQRTRAITLLGTAYAATRVLQHGAQFESQLRAFGNVGGLASKQIADVGEQLRLLSTRVNQSKTALLGGVDFLVGKGLSVNKATRAIATIGKAATASGASVIEMAAASNSMMENMQISAEQLSGALDIIASSGKQGGFELKDMARFFPVITAQAKQLGLTGKQGIATLGASLQIAMKGAGDPSVAANNLQNFLAKITSKETVNNLNKLGVSVKGVFGDAKASGKDPVIEIIKEINRVTKGDAFALNTIFGDMQVKNFINPMLQNMDEFYKIRKKSLTAQQVISKDFDAILTTATSKTKKFTIGLVNIGDAFSDSVMPAIKPLLTILGSLAQATGDIIKKYPLIGQVLGAAAAIFGLITLGSIGYTASVWLLNTATVTTMWSTTRWIAVSSFGIIKFVAMKTAIAGITAAQWLWNVALAANPIGLVIAGVAAFAGLAFVVYKKWEPIKQFFMDLWGTVGKVVEKVTGFFGGGDSQTSGSRKSRRNAVIGAVLAAPVAALPANAATTAPASVVNQQQYHITQLPGESGEKLARRIAELQQEHALREEADVR